MKMFSETYLFQLFKYSKFLFLMGVLFIAFTLLCNIKGQQITPFFVWGMYSDKKIMPPEVNVYRVYSNNKEIDLFKLTETNRFLIVNTLANYQMLTKKDTRDPNTRIFYLKGINKKYGYFGSIIDKILITQSQVDDYPNWLKKYLSISTHKPIYNLKVETNTFFFNAFNLPVFSKSNILINE